MNNPNSPSNPAPRATLKLKAGVQKAPREAKVAATPAPQPQQSKSNSKPGAHWSDEYKQRMQADMDALTSR
jgi:hypothetical protein